MSTNTTDSIIPLPPPRIHFCPLPAKKENTRTHTHTLRLRTPHHRPRSPRPRLPVLCLPSLIAKGRTYLATPACRRWPDAPQRLPGSLPQSRKKGFVSAHVWTCWVLGCYCDFSPGRQAGRSQQARGRERRAEGRSVAKLCNLF